MLYLMGTHKIFFKTLLHAQQFQDNTKHSTIQLKITRILCIYLDCMSIMGWVAYGKMSIKNFMAGITVINILRRPAVPIKTQKHSNIVEYMFKIFNTRIVPI